LPMAGIDPDDASGTSLQQTIHESAGRSANIQAHAAGHVDSPMIKRAFKFETTSAHVFEVFIE